MGKDGAQDISIINDIFDDIKRYELQSTVVLKSTTLPDKISQLYKVHNNIVVNPEFLREAHATEDFVNSDLIIFGGKKEDCQKVSSFYKKYTSCIQDNHIFTDPISASLIKYAINCFLSTKVIFFNQLKEIFEATDAQNGWDEFVNIISLDKRIGDSHMQVPGPDGRLGFGGACFPKDTRAIISLAENMNLEFDLLKEVVNINNNIRCNYNIETEREREQNIVFE